MVTVCVVSDLHLEARPLDLDAVLQPGHTADVLCLLGDIGDPSSPAYRDFIAAVAPRFPTVLLLAGNNEYRNRHSHHHHSRRPSIGKQQAEGEGTDTGRAGTPAARGGRGEGGGSQHGADGYLRHAAAAAAAAESPHRSMAQTEELIRAVAAEHPNVHFLQNGTHVVGRVAFIGTTLWSYLPDDPLPLPEEVDSPAPAAGTATASATSAAAAVPAAVAAAVAAAVPAAVPTVIPAAGAAALPGGGERQDRSAPWEAEAARQRSAGGGAGLGARADTGATPATPELAGALSRAPSGCAQWAQCSPPSAAQPIPMQTSPRGWPLRGPTTLVARPPTQVAQSLPAPASRFDRDSSCSQAGAGADNDGGAADGQGRGGAGGVAPCVRRRVLLRHCVSLSKLPPDAPCPPLFVSREASTASHSSGSSGSRSSSSGSGGSEGDSGSNSGSSSSESEAEGESGRASAPTSHALQLPALASQLAAMQLRSLSEAASAAASPTRPDPPAPAEGLHHHTPKHHHHHHHHHHRRPSSSSAAAAASPAAMGAPPPPPPPPAPPRTIREYIAATSLDFRRIHSVPGGPPITPDTTNALHAASLAYLAAAVAAARGAGLTPVVLSHHAPSLRGTSHPRFAGHPSTHAYGTDLEPFLEGSGIAAWYCGHTHHNFDMLLRGNVRLASNQFGSQPQPAAGYSTTWRHALPEPGQGLGPSVRGVAAAGMLPSVPPARTARAKAEAEEPEEGSSLTAALVQRGASPWRSAAKGRSLLAGMAPAGVGFMGVQC
ncbi:hypothetical protein GPECTOR_336g68 [Gonium pectorale]|uniref:Calcineurin-like phosphoesterase domain-containing protein n=1 Tax=Gonium pectorale TaxID=33097 RepID=A0A150FXA4_GONPE|nr:hypothetical protein GPECTOR_336g68 [Gonium pectorale]|eukprot:KXZ41660.1 hypothetical protein GPECTOR_336g68 [Gonium pectorale]